MIRFSNVHCSADADRKRGKNDWSVTYVQSDSQKYDSYESVLFSESRHNAFDASAV